MLFSIIVPIWNVAPYLPACLESVRAQREPSWEALCVEDGGTDAGGDVLVEAIRQDPRIRAVFQRNAGVSRARNRALTRVRGEYVAFVDGDDTVAPWWLSEVKRLFDASQADLVRFTIVEHSVEPAASYQAPVEGMRVIEGNAAIQAWGWSHFRYYGYAWLSVMTRALAQATPFPTETRLKEDTIYGFCLLPKLTRVCLSESAPFFYRMHPRAVTQRRQSVAIPCSTLEGLRVLTAPTDRRARRHLATFAWYAVVDWVYLPEPTTAAERLRLRRTLDETFRVLRLSFVHDLSIGWWPAVALYRAFGWCWMVTLTSAGLRCYGIIRSWYRSRRHG